MRHYADSDTSNISFLPIVLLALVFNCTNTVGFTYADRDAVSIAKRPLRTQSETSISQKRKWATGMAASSMLGQLGGVGGSLVGGLRRANAIGCHARLTVCEQSVAGRRRSSDRQIDDNGRTHDGYHPVLLHDASNAPKNHLVRARTTYSGSPERLLGSTVTISMSSYS